MQCFTEFTVSNLLLVVLSPTTTVTEKTTDTILEIGMIEDNTSGTKKAI